jgi:hypothetical protein
MRVIDPGHIYELRHLDDPVGESFSMLKFVKREGDGYPGNVGHYSGTTTQEVLRALVDRAKYVDNQIHDNANDQVLWHLRMAIWHLEERAARRHGRKWNFKPEQIEDLSVCRKCNHIGCEGDCH